MTPSENPRPDLSPGDHVRVSFRLSPAVEAVVLERPEDDSPWVKVRQESKRGPYEFQADIAFVEKLNDAV